MSQQINLFNPIFMKRRKYFSLLAMLQALGMIIAGSLFFYGYAIDQVGQLKKQSEESNKRYNAEEARLIRLTAEFSPQQADQALQNEVRRLEKQLADWSHQVRCGGQYHRLFGIHARLLAPGGAGLVVDRFQGGRGCDANQLERRRAEP